MNYSTLLSLEDGNYILVGVGGVNPGVVKVVDPIFGCAAFSCGRCCKLDYFFCASLHFRMRLTAIRSEPDKIYPATIG